MAIEQNAIASLFIAIMLTIPVAWRFRHTRTKASRIIDEAARNGNFVMARHVRTYYPTAYDRENGCDRYIYADYEYELNGRTRKIRRRFHTVNTPSSLKLYYDPKHPKRVYAHDFDRLGAPYALVMCTPVIFFLIIFAVLQAVSAFR